MVVLAQVLLPPRGSTERSHDGSGSSEPLSLPATAPLPCHGKGGERCSRRSEPTLYSPLRKLQAHQCPRSSAQVTSHPLPRSSGPPRTTPPSPMPQLAAPPPPPAAAPAPPTPDPRAPPARPPPKNSVAPPASVHPSPHASRLLMSLGGTAISEEGLQQRPPRPVPVCDDTLQRGQLR